MRAERHYTDIVCWFSGAPARPRDTVVGNIDASYEQGILATSRTVLYVYTHVYIHIHT